MKRYFLYLLSACLYLLSNCAQANDHGLFTNNSDESIYVLQIDNNTHGGDIYIGSCEISTTGQVCTLEPHNSYAVTWTTYHGASFDCLGFLTNPTDASSSLLPNSFYQIANPDADDDDECYQNIDPSAYYATEQKLYDSGAEIGFDEGNFNFNPSLNPNGVDISYHDITFNNP